MKRCLQPKNYYALILAFLAFSFGANAQDGCSITEINFNDYTFNSYGGNQDATGTFSASQDGTEVLLDNNAWKSIDFQTEITPNTYLKFEFKSDLQGERHGIGFDNNDDLNNSTDLPRFFQVYGTEVTITNNDYNTYFYNGEWESFSIPVGQIISGNYSKLVFMSDDDGSEPLGNSYFRNIRIVEGDGVTCTLENGEEGILEDCECVLPPCSIPDGIPCTLENGYDGIIEDCECVVLPSCPAIDLSEYEVTSYGASANQDAGTFELIDEGEGIMIMQNAWKAIDYNYNVTPNTMLKLEFKSTVEGEIHGIGLDDDDNQTANRTFQFYGTQSNFGIQTFNNYVSGDGWKEYIIPIGTFSNNQGARTRLFFVGDDDDTPVDANSYFRNIKIYEQGECNPNCIAPTIIPCEGPIYADAGAEDCLAEVDFEVFAEGTNPSLSYEYEGEPISSPAIFGLGVHVITATATNECGTDVSNCLTIEVSDVTEPTAHAQNIEVELGSDGTASITAEDIDNGSSDSCGEVELSINIDSFDCSNIGSNTVTLTVSDASGNDVAVDVTVDVLAPEVLASASMNSSIELTEENNNVVIFADAPASAGLAGDVVLTANLSPDSYTAADYQWYVKDIAEAEFTLLVDSTDADIHVFAEGDSQKEYKVVITTTSNCTAEAIQSVYSVDTSCKNANKVLVCMVPPGNPDNAHEICVNVNALDGLLANTDSYVGSCDVDYKMNEGITAEVQLYPNPTNGNVSLSYMTSEDGRVRMEVYNITGQLVEVLYEGSVQGDINFTRNYDLRSWENGIYLFRIIQEDIVQTKRLVLSK